MKKIIPLLLNLKPADFIVVIFYTLLTTTNIIFHEEVEQWHLLIILNIGVISFSFLIAYLEKRHNARVIRIIHYWYLAPLILLTFKELYLMIKPIRGADFDQLLIEADRWLFGGDPTVMLYSIANPLLTEILQIIYGTFYLLPIFLGLVLWKKKKMLSCEFAIFSVIYGFFLSYMGYFLLPGVGPRFTLHNFEMTNYELPGLLLTNILRDIVNTGESIPPGTVNPAELVQRDVFPSGHTMITLVVMYLSVRLNSRSKYFFLPVGSLLIFATVYLRYHYVVDLIGGLVFMIFSLWSGKYVFNWWRRITGREEFEYYKTKINL